MRPLDPNLEREWLRRVRPRAAGKGPRRSPGRDRRSNPRFPIANTDISNPTIRGSVVDLSRAGMAIESHEALRPGQTYGLTLTIGEHVETLEVRVLWCRLSGTRRQPDGDVLPVYRAGIERMRPEESDAKAGGDQA